MDKPVFNDAFVNKYGGLVYTAIERRLKGCGMAISHEDMLDIKQEVLLSIFENGKLDTISDPKSTPYWVAIVSGNIAIQYMRKRRRTEMLNTVSLNDRLEDLGLIDTISSPDPGPGNELLRNEAADRIDRAVESLPYKEKLILKLHLIHEKKYDEISEILHIPDGTVSSYIMRAKARLKRLLKEIR